jgi:hypothetical protein
LTAIPKRNAGVFPFNRVFETADGRQDIGAHGVRDMPIWGFRYNPSPILGFSSVAPYLVRSSIGRASSGAEFSLLWTTSIACARKDLCPPVGRDRRMRRRDSALFAWCIT